MAVSTELLERSGDLKGEILDYARQRRFARELEPVLERQYGWDTEIDEATFINALDWFVLQHRLRDGRAVVEYFVAEHPELPEEERAMLLGWRDVVEGMFEVQQREGESLVVVNLIDELTYRVHSNTGPGTLSRMRPGSFLATRLVPIGDEWLLSGTASVLPASRKAEVYRTMADFAPQHPELAFRNPAKLAQAWEVQRKEHKHFVDFFGTDLVVLPAHEVDERMQAYTQYRMHEARDDEGKTAADHYQERYDAAAPRLDFQVTSELPAAETVGIISDEIEGLNFFTGFGIVAETFANPALVADRGHRQAMLDYLKEPEMSPLPLRRLAEQDPERASQVFQRLLKKPRFSWERDGEAMLHHYKASFFAQPVLPSVTPLSDSLTRAKLHAPEPPLMEPTRPASARPRPDYRPARRGKKKRTR